MTQHNKSGAVRTVEAWCCGIAADDELGGTNVTVYESKESCEKANQCAVNDPKWCAPRKLSITFDTNWVPADQLPAPVADAGVKRPEPSDGFSGDAFCYEQSDADAYMDSLELQLKTVIDRESATTARYDAKVDALEFENTTLRTRLEAAQKQSAWIDVKQKLPEMLNSTPDIIYSEDVLCFNGKHVITGWLGKWGKDPHSWASTSGSKEPVTHWMPLPEPPVSSSSAASGKDWE